MKETYAQARIRLFNELQRIGWQTSPATNKVLWAQPDAQSRHLRVSFKSQSVYLGVHSMFLDFRGMKVEEFLSHFQRGIIGR